MLFITSGGEKEMSLVSVFERRLYTVPLRYGEQAYSKPQDSTCD